MGADVSGPVFKSIAHKIYTNSLLIDTVEDVDRVSETTTHNYEDYYAKAAKYKTVYARPQRGKCYGCYSLIREYGLARQSIRARQSSRAISTERHAYSTNTVVVLQCGELAN